MTSEERGSLASLETVVHEARQDIADVRIAFEKALEQMDTRVTQLEEVRVRALEDWRLSERVLATERARVAEAAAVAVEQAAEDRKHSLSRRDAAIIAAVMVVATILGALIASGRIF